MTKTIFVQDIMRGVNEVNDLFIVTKKGTYTARNNSRYMMVGLKDSTGSIEGRVWEHVDELEGLFEKGDIVSIHSKARVYQDKLQLHITDIRKLDSDLTISDIEHFYPCGDIERSRLEKEYSEIVSGIRNEHLKMLFDIFNDEKVLHDRFLTWPASTGVHHVYVGGLLEHSLSVAKMGMAVAALIGGDRDIITAGSIFHDIGKVRELEITRGFRYTDRGRLLGHITLGVMLLEDLIGRIDGFPQGLTDILTHIIISHHGLEEWGSPKKPMFPEALIVHHLDNLDSKVMGVREHMRDNMIDDRWSGYHRLYEAKFYKIN
ncbi:MAG: HD domain-containing protein [Syntrophorhabdaceae bacterium]|nr:HD domain-containing protein [Syntrophorhabdaceae bacterium]MDD4195979.1 HD domain-containing protein [Syntrophorhabdaceae bacterium]